MELLKGAVFAYDVISFPFYFATQRPWAKRRAAKRKRAAQVNPSDPYSPWIRVGRPKPCVADNCKTLDELVRVAVGQHRGKRCIGVRPVLMEETSDGPDSKPVVKKTLAENFEWMVTQ